MSEIAWPDEKSRQMRRHADTESVAVGDFRSPFQHDRDRIMYSSSYRRLAGVTQVTTANGLLLNHNRLTHSAKVGQVGRRVTEHLLEKAKRMEWPTDSDGEWPGRTHLNADVVETAGLAHDLGHPPFGHIAETELDKLARECELDGFEGNAQSFRIVTKLAVGRTESQGVDLTRASLNAILKYPCLTADKLDIAAKRELSLTDRTRGTKWGVYTTELLDFEYARLDIPVGLRTLEATLMDWADDISYATHDIEDYFRAGLIPLHDLAREEAPFRRFLDKRLGRDVSSSTDHGFPKVKFDLLDRACDYLLGPNRTGVSAILAPYGASVDDRRKLRLFISGLISSFMDALTPIADAPFVKIDEGAQYRVEVLKALNWYYVIDRPQLSLVQHGQRRLIRNLFHALMELLEEEHEEQLFERDDVGACRRVPALLRHLLLQIKHDPEAEDIAASANKRRARAICDYMCMLTEEQVVEVFERLTLTAVPRSIIFGAWLH